MERKNGGKGKKGWRKVERVGEKIGLGEFYQYEKRERSGGAEREEERGRERMSELISDGNS